MNRKDEIINKIQSWENDGYDLQNLIEKIDYIYKNDQQKNNVENEDYKKIARWAIIIPLVVITTLLILFSL
ncbi:MAG: hypothetical protein KGY67_09290 [Candidatus Thermoplasmatota archaeon]|nr:hypothetical protein [Candidatus Thermoplasmatota archaeon]